MNLLKGKVSFFLISLLSCLLMVGPQASIAGTVDVFLDEKGLEQKPYIFIKGSDVNLTNIYQSKITSMVLINTASEKRLLKIDELQIGQSIQIGFDQVGNYHLIYKIMNASSENIHKRLLIKVVNASSA